MKSSQRFITLLSTAALVLAGTATAQSNRPSAATTDTNAAGIARVTKDSVKNRFTAKDLIGAAVYDTAGEKIGDIADIDLQSAVPGPLASSYNSDQAADHSATRPAPAPMPDTTARPSRPTSGADSNLAHATVFLSVGGLFGIGDDLVSVPVSQLNYNPAADRFELAVAKAAVVSLAENRQGGYASDAAPAATRAGKQSFADEATRVQNALASDPQTSAFAQKVTVMTAGDGLEIHGIVDNKEQKKRILDAARRATSMDVDDKIDVK